MWSWFVVLLGTPGHASTTPPNISNFFPWGVATGDSVIDPCDDRCDTPYNLPGPFSFFGSAYTRIHVNNNGILNFGTVNNDATVSAYTPYAFPVANYPCVCPFWGDVDTRGGPTYKGGYTSPNSFIPASAYNGVFSQVYNCISGTSTATKTACTRAQLEVRSRSSNFPDVEAFAPNFVMHATWMLVDVFQYAKQTKPFEVANTFQAVLIQGNNIASGNPHSFVMFIYPPTAINWLYGDASGIPAQVGFDAGDQTNSYAVPGSRNTSLPTVLNGNTFFFETGAATISAGVLPQPIVWNIYPSNVQTSANVPITIIGYNFGTSPVVQVGGATCTNTFANNTMIICTLPPGQGNAVVTVVANGRGLLQLPNWATDMSFKSTVTSSGSVDTSSSTCTNLPQPSSSFWSDDYFCGVLSKAKLSAVWSTTGRVAGMDCVNILNSNSTTWGTQTYYCLPPNGPYNLTWSQTGSIPGKSCVSFGDILDPAWSRPLYYLCSDYQDPYGTAGVLTYSYAPPVITAISPLSGPTAGGTIVTINGTSFGNLGNGQVFFDSLSCPLVGTYTHTSLFCQSPAGEGNKSITLTVGTASSQRTFVWSYNPPSIMSFTPTTLYTSPIAPAERLTINGINFGVNSAFVTIGGVACPPVTWTPTQIVCTQTGVGTSQLLVVTNYYGQQDDAKPSKSIDFLPPQLSSVTPTTASTQGGTVLTIVGRNFGTTSIVTVGGASCPLTGTGYTQQQILCSLPSGQGSGLFIYVTVAGQTSNPPLLFSYQPPTVVSVTPNIGVIGAQLVITGSSFGITGTTYINGVVASCSSWQHTQLICAAPSSTGLNVVVRVSSGGAMSNTDITFTYRPTLSSIQPTTLATDSTALITVVGTGFDTSTVLVHRVMLTGSNFTFRNSTTLVYANPQGEGTVTVSATTSSIASSTTLSLIYLPPVITSVAPTNGSTSGNTTVTIFGNNFGRPVADLSVMIGGNPAVVVSHDHHQIMVITPAGVGVGRNVIVTVGGQTSNSGSYDYLPPVISTAIPSHATTGGGVVITLVGDGFGTGGTVYIGSLQTSTISASPSQATFLLPAGSGTQPVTIRPTGNSVSNVISFTYDPPTVNTLAPLLGPTTGNNILTILGSSLSVNPAVAIGLSVCPLQSINDTVLTCRVPAGQGFANVVVTASGRAISSPVPYQYAPPSINSTSPITGPTDGGYLLTLTGSNFGLSGTVNIGPQVCSTADSSAVWSHTLVKCIVPAGQNRSLRVVITVAGQLNQASQLFSYLPPQIVAVSYAPGPAAATLGGTVLFLTGSNFGSSAFVTLQGLGQCVPTSLPQTNEQYECTAPAGQGTGILLNMTVGNQNNGAQASPVTVSYNAPVFTSATPVLFTTSANVVMVLNGTNLGLNTSIVITLSAPFKNSITPVNRGLDSSGTLLSFVIPPGTGANWKATATIANQPATFSLASGTSSWVNFAYSPPSISSAAGCPTANGQGTASCPVLTNTSLVLTGSNFGTNLSLASVQIGSGSTAQNCPVTSVSHTSLQCTLQVRPAGGFNLLVQVTVDGQISPAVVLVSYAGPTITSGTLKLSSGSPNGNPSLITASSGASIFLQGIDWTTRGTSSDAVWIRIGAPGTDFSQKPLNCSKPVGQPVNQFVTTAVSGISSVTCNLPVGTVGQNLSLQIQTGLQISTESADRVSFPPPSIVDGSIRVNNVTTAGANRAQGLLNSGDVVFFNVLNCGTDATLLTVNYGQNQSMTKPCLGVALSGNVLSCTTTEGYGTDYQFQITALNYAGPISNVYFDYPTVPTVTSVSGCAINTNGQTYSCPTAGGVTLSLVGTGFSAGGRVRVGGVVCENLFVSDPQHLTCTLPQGAGDPASVDVAVVALISIPYPYIHYAAATITSLTSADCSVLGSDVVNCPRNGLDITGLQPAILTMTGTNFGTPTAKVLIGGVECTNVLHNAATPDSKLVCQLPTGTREQQEVYLFQHNGLLTSSDRTVSFQQCAVGSAALSGTIQCSPCAAGTFADQVGSFTCKTCPSGTYAANQGSSQCTQCPRGNYSVASGSVGPVSCSACAPGTYSDSVGLQECTICPGGKFSSSYSSQSCQPCDIGNYQSLTAQSFCTACDQGNYASVTGAQSCSSCLAGTKSVPTSGGTGCDACTAGKYGADRISCTDCETGKASSGIRQISCTTCGSGYFSNTTGTLRCLTCPPGTVSTPDVNGNGATACSQCSAGWYMPSSGQAVCIQCPVGSFSNSSSATACEQCAPGTYASQLGATICSSCNVGAFAPGYGAVQCFDCGLGTYNNDTGNADCKQCSVGSYQGQTGRSTCSLCQEGTANAASGQAICLPCQSGSYASGTGASVCSKCSYGTFSNTFGGSIYTGPTTCTQCDVGTYASSSGSAQCDPCPIGYMMNGTGAQICTPCQAGTAIEFTGQSVCRNCAPGRFSPTSGVVTCLACDRGTFQELSGQTSCSGCAAGEYQLSSGGSSCEPCSSGTFSVAGSAGCTNCPVGSFSSNSSALFCTPCDIGTYQSHAGASYCDRCAEGRVTLLTGQGSCTPCDPGSYATGLGNSRCTPCPIGAAQSKSGSASCSNCTAGSFTNVPGASNCDQCPAGSYNDQDSQSSCVLCSPGSSQALAGQQSCNLCDNGTAVNAYGATNCVPCDGGFYSAEPGTVTCNKCPPGSASSRAQGASVGPTSCNLCLPTTYVSSPGQPACWNCPAGSFGDRQGMTECTPCAPGTMQDQPLSKTCNACPAGKFSSSSGSLVCQDCPAGSISNTSAASSCYQCPSGKAASADGFTICSDCQQGYFADTPGTIQCKPCAPGSAVNATGQDTCPPCQPGTAQPREGQLSCLSCQAGQAAPLQGAKKCLACAPGTAAPHSGTATCDVCPAGSFSLEQGAVGCTLCPTGRAASSPGSNLCQVCISGKFAPQGAVNCTDCQGGTYQNNPESSSCIPCSGGYFAGAASSSCTQCPNGQVAPSNRSVACFACQEWSTTNPARTACTCQPGFAFASINNGTSQCKQCPVGANCVSYGNVYDALQTLPGYWSANSNFYRCLLDDNCVGGNSSCAPNRFGPLCAQCISGYTTDITNKCVPCVNKSRSIGFVIGVTIAIVVALLIQYAIVLRAGNLKNFTSTEDQTVREPSSSSSQGQPIEDQQARPKNEKKAYPSRSRFNGPFTVFGTPNPPPNFTFKLKIALGFAQIITNLVVGLTIQWPSSFKRFISAFNIANFDFFQGAQFGCVVESSYWTKLWVSVIFPPVLIIGILFFYVGPSYAYIAWRAHLISPEDQRTRRKTVRQLFWRLTIFTLFLVYPSVSAVILRGYICRVVEGVSYLQGDFSIQCGSESWRSQARSAAVFAVIYPIGIPLFFFLMLFRYRHRLEEPAVRMEMGILYDAYERKAWWFEMVDMAHKLLLCCILGFFPSNMQMPAGMIIAALYMIIVLLFKPYIRKGDDRLLILAQSELLCLMLAGNTLNLLIEPDLTMEVVMTIILIAAFILFFTYLLITSFTALKKLWLDARQGKKDVEEQELPKLSPGQDFYSSLVVLNAARKQDQNRNDAYLENVKAVQSYYVHRAHANPYKSGAPKQIAKSTTTESKEPDAVVPSSDSQAK